jgi:hypothetical protein
MSFRYLVVVGILFFSQTLYAVNVGVIGDSINDEYLYKTDAAALGWVQILSRSRSDYINFGTYESDPTVRGPGRYDGYEYNWAEAGATAREGGMPFDPNIWDGKKQAAGLAQNISAGDIDIAVVHLGDNDVRFRTFFGEEVGYDEIWEQDVVDSIFDSIGILQTASQQANKELSVIVSTIGLVPKETPAANESRARINSMIEERAAAEGIFSFKILSFFDGPERKSQNGFQIGDLTITEFVNKAGTDADDFVLEGTPGAGACNSKGLCAGPHHAKHLSADDTFGHLNTAVQGLMANEVIRAMNASAPGLNIPELSDQEIVSFTGYIAPVPVPVPPAVGFFALSLVSLASVKYKKRIS